MTRSLQRMLGGLAIATVCACNHETAPFNGPLGDWSDEADAQDRELRRLQLLSRGCNHARQANRAKARANKKVNKVRPEHRSALLERARFHLDQAKGYFDAATELLDDGQQLQDCDDKGRGPNESQKPKTKPAAARSPAQAPEAAPGPSVQQAPTQR